MASERRPPPRAVLGQEALAAVAVPVRYALLNHLLAAGPRTASQCAAVVGQSASNCSWHLRALAKVGLVEPAPGDGDARTRPWQAVAPGFAVEPGDGPAARVAATVLESVAAQHSEALYQRYLARRDLLPDRWQHAAADNGYSLQVTPEELQHLLDAVDGLLRPYVRPIRAEAPQDSGVVQVTLRAFLNPDVVDDAEESAEDGADPS
jgi:hypothetical protein